MLKSVLIEVDVIVIVVGIGEELVLRCKNVRCRNVLLWQIKALRLGRLYHLVAFIPQVLSLFIAQVRIHRLVANDLEGSLHANRPVVRGDDNTGVFFGDLFQNVEQWRMNEPRFSDGAVCGFVGGEFADHGHVGPRVRKHVHKIIHDYIEVIGEKVIDRIRQVPSLFEFLDLMIDAVAEDFSITLTLRGALPRHLLQNALVETF